jgi:hypothetical protein
MSAPSPIGNPKPVSTPSEHAILDGTPAMAAEPTGSRFVD